MTSPLTPWHGDTEAKPAPGPLRRVQAFINTIDRESGQDRLATDHDAQPWLVEHALLDTDTELTDDDLGVLAAVREGLRALVLQNTDGSEPSLDAVAPLRDIADREPARATFTDDGAVRIMPTGDGLGARLLGLLLDVADAQRDGTWAHMKTCANEECQWAFYDRSRNHGGTWCDMATCGNKLKNRDFRARRRTAD